mgnify:CR=1 FL=1
MLVADEKGLTGVWFEEIKMPEATVSDKTIDVLKSLYSSYLEITKKS